MTILTLALTTILFSSPASPEPAAKGPDTWTPLSFTVFNECTGESERGRKGRGYSSGGTST